MALESCKVGLFLELKNDFFFANRCSGARGSRSTELWVTLKDGDLEELLIEGDTGLQLCDLEQSYYELMPCTLLTFNDETN